MATILDSFCAIQRPINNIKTAPTICMLSNYGAGLAIIATRPFVVGDTIEVKNVSGQVKTIELGYTILIDEEKVEITIPNKHKMGWGS